VDPTTALVKGLWQPYANLMLSSKQRQALKALAHHLEPVILVGKKGITEPLVEETKHALRAHELIKVKFHEGGDLEAPAQQLADGAGATLVNVQGKTAVLYTPHPEKPRIKIPE
jgi:RNA-binding protein